MNARPLNRIHLLCVVTAVLLFFQTYDAVAEFRAAIAARDVTPDPLLPVSGGVGPTHPTTRRFGKLTVRALTLENDGTRVSVCSTDFLGPLYDRIRQRTGGTGIFMNGALGGMVTADCRGPDGKDIQTWDECIRIGHLLADEALRIIDDAPALDDPKVFCGDTTIKFPVDNQMLRAVVEMSPLGFELEDGKNISTQVNVMNIGSAQILTIPGEALPNMGYYLKRKMHGEHNLLFGLTNDAFGYIMVKEDFDSFERYEYITRTCLGEMTGQIFIEEALKFADACPRPE